MRKPNHRGPDLMEVRRLWGHGMTDDQIAASMGISTRSAQRARLKAGLAFYHLVCLILIGGMIC